MKTNTGHQFTLLRCALVFLLVLGSLVIAARSEAQTTPPNTIAGTWRSTYLCNGVVDAVVEYTIVETGPTSVEAAVAYHITNPMYKPALFILRGPYDPVSGVFELRPHRWVDNANNVQMVGIRGQYMSAQDAIQARFQPEVCWNLDLKRQDAPVLIPDVYAHLSAPQPSSTQAPQSVEAPARVPQLQASSEPDAQALEENEQVSAEDTNIETVEPPKASEVQSVEEPVVKAEAPVLAESPIASTGLELTFPTGQPLQTAFETLPLASLQIGTATYVSVQNGCQEPLFVTKVSTPTLAASLVEASDPLGFVLKQEGISAFKEVLCPDVGAIEAGRIAYVFESDVLGFVDFSISLDAQSPISVGRSRTLDQTKIDMSYVDWRTRIWAGEARRLNGSLEKEVKRSEDSDALHLRATYPATEALDIRILNIEKAGLDRKLLKEAGNLNYAPSLIVRAAQILESRGVVDKSGRVIDEMATLSDSQKSSVTLLIARAAAQNFLPAQRYVDVLRNGGIDIDLAIEIAKENEGEITLSDLESEPTLTSFPSPEEAKSALERYLVSSNCKTLASLARDLTEKTPGGLGLISDELKLATSAGTACIVPFGSIGHLGMGIGKVQGMQCSDKGLAKSCFLEAFLTCVSELDRQSGQMRDRLPECGTLRLDLPMEMRISFTRAEDESWVVSRQQSAPQQDVSKAVGQLLRGRLARACTDMRSQIASGGLLSTSFSKGTCRLSSKLGPYTDMWFERVDIGSCKGNVCEFRTKNACYAKGVTNWGSCGEWYDNPWRGTFRRDSKGRVYDLVVQ